jgi:hypothetical protein
LHNAVRLPPPPLSTAQSPPSAPKLTANDVQAHAHAANVCLARKARCRTRRRSKMPLSQQSGRRSRQSSKHSYAQRSTSSDRVTPARTRRSTAFDALYYSKPRRQPRRSKVRSITVTILLQASEEPVYPFVESPLPPHTCAACPLPLAHPPARLHATAACCNQALRSNLRLGQPVGGHCVQVHCLSHDRRAMRRSARPPPLRPLKPVQPPRSCHSRAHRRCQKTVQCS